MNSETFPVKFEDEKLVNFIEKIADTDLYPTPNEFWELVYEAQDLLKLIKK